ncbi:hypothetical protein MHK_004043 [Candidatus Magnetomorum sp. HK-1]|nr:hypothetical protein MHK_004043 [Candidatus Magnetomorum sp. HK-1]
MYIFRTDNKHIEYWVEHCLPVIVVLYHPDEDILYWKHVSKKSCVITGKEWKISISKNKQLTEKSLKELCKLIQPPPYIQKINRLRLDKFWIDLVDKEEFVYVEFEDFLNKSLPRFSIKIGCDYRDDIEEESWPTIWGILRSPSKLPSFQVQESFFIAIAAFSITNVFNKSWLAVNGFF